MVAKHPNQQSQETHFLDSHVGEFLKNGVVKIESFLTDEACNKVLDDIKLAKEIALQESSETSTTFSTLKESSGNSFFLESGDKIRIFYEDEDSSVINKIGHGLHLNSHLSAIQEFCFHKTIATFFKKLNYVRPVCIQSMFMAKEPFIGGIVKPHQDSTYLYTEPQSTIAAWLALSDATLDNGCLWGVLGSHKGPLCEVLKTNDDRSDTFIETRGEKLPSFDPELFTTLPVKKGDVVIFDGNFIHYSAKNTSPHARPAITFHYIETHNTNYLDFNWLQPISDRALFDATR